MFRKLSKNGLQLIKKLEGCELIAYKDSGGVYTIGYGHTKNVKRGMTITQKQAEVFLKEDCNKFVDHVNKYMNTYNFNQNQFDALVSFAFNIGSINELTKNGSRSISEISNKILLYNKCNGKFVKGLLNRRKAEKQLFDKPVKTTTQIAKEVIKGLWGNGNSRKQKLLEKGYDYKVVQEEVNKLLKR